MDQVDGARDVGVDDAARLAKILIQEPFAEAAACIGQQRSDRTCADPGIELVDAFDGGEIGLERIDGCAGALEAPRRLLDLRFVGDDQQVETVLGAAFCKLVTYAGRCTGYDCEGTSLGHFSISEA